VTGHSHQFLYFWGRKQDQKEAVVFSKSSVAEAELGSPGLEDQSCQACPNTSLCLGRNTAA